MIVMSHVAHLQSVQVPTFPVALNPTNIDVERMIQEQTTSKKAGEEGGDEEIELLADDSSHSQEHSTPQPTVTVQTQSRGPTYSFRIRIEEVEPVRRQCIQLDYPLIEEYNFKKCSRY